ncbi:MAG: permease [Methanobacteriota archaeon]|nr:MAG: permease [Euryarchaeota archaeon]
MSALDYLASLLVASFEGLINYMSAHVLLCLIPAFFIAGALSALFRKEAITKYLGPETPKYISYPVASAAGLLIAVCSCTILPLFAGIWKKGAGLGPAVTFLFTGPAINLLAITYTGSLIGWDIAAARSVMAIAFGIVIGLLMGFIFSKIPTTAAAFNNSSPSPCALSAAADSPEEKAQRLTLKERMHRSRSLVLLVLLIGVLLSGTFPAPLEFRIPALTAFILLSVAWALKANSREENGAWMSETYFFIKMIVPLLLIGVFVAGIASEVIPSDLVAEHLGNDTLSANSIAVAFGIFMYFPTLVEVPVARMFLDLGMAKGPLLAYLLADPELSFQSVLVTRKVMGSKKVAVYVGLVAVFCVAAGMIFGMLVR